MWLLPLLFVCVCSGLLAGLWEFPSLILEEKNSEIKQKRSLRDEVSRVLGTHLTENLLQYVGEVRFTFSTYLPSTFIHKSAVSRAILRSLQVVHIFSHIHQTYVVYSVCLKEAGAHTQTENTQWLTRSALLEAAVSTGLKKVCVFYTLLESESLLCNST